MRAWRYRFVAGLMFLGLSVIKTTCALAAETESSQADWDNLKKLAVGQRVQVVLNDAKSYGGQFQSASDEGLVLRTGERDQTFERDKVQRVSAKSKGHRGRNALIGMGAGRLPV